MTPLEARTTLAAAPTRLAVLAVVIPALAVGCGWSGGDGEDGFVNPCEGLRGLSRDRATDRTGEANTLEHARRVRDKYTEAIRRHCKEWTGDGIGRIGMKPDVDPKDHVITVYLKRGDDLPPDRSLFLEGVPLRFRVTGEVRALRRWAKRLET
jgi:hypothetical protein